MHLVQIEMKKAFTRNNSCSGTASEDKNTEASSATFQFSMRALLSLSVACGALAGIGSLIQRSLESNMREAHSTTATSELLIAAPDIERPGIFLTIKRGEKNEQPSARLIEKYVEDACSQKTKYLTGLRLDRLANPDSDFTVLNSIASIGDLSINDCDQLTGALFAYIPSEIGSIALYNLPNFNGDALSMLADKSIGSIVFTNTPLHDKDLVHLSQVSGLQMVAFTETNCSLKAISHTLKDTKVKMVTFKSSKDLDRASEEVRLMEAWCNSKTERTCLLIDKTKSLILKSSNNGTVEITENLPIFTSPPVTKL